MGYAALRTPRLLLRAWSEQDLEPFARMNADARVMEHMPRCLAREDSDAFVERIAKHFDEHGYGLWAVQILDGDRFIGFIGLQWATFDAPFTPALEVGFRLAHEHWNRGFATEGGRAAIAWAFENTKLGEIVSFTAGINARSRRVIENLGLVRDEAGDFDHPRVDPGSPLRPHVLFRITRPGSRV